MIRTRIFVMALMLCWACAPAWAEEPETTGTLSMEGRLVDESGDNAKFEEYRDMDSGVDVDLDIRTNIENGYVELEAENFGLYDQSYRLQGGKYDHYKLTVYYDETPHNFTEDAKSYLDGAGTNVLTNSGNIADPGLWGTYDYYKARQNSGFTGEFSFATPWYATVGASRQTTRGIVPFAGNGGVELPAPVDWEEKNLFAEGGFRGRRLTISLRADLSNFDNEYAALNWDTETTSLQPDSEFIKFAGNVVYRSSFMDSVFGLGTSLSKKDNETEMADVDATATGTYHADVETFRIDGSWDFVPARAFDVKLYSRYYDTEDNSDTITVNSVTTEPYDHEKWTSGLEGTWRLPRKNYLDAGYRYVDAQRSSRSDSDDNQDNLVFLQYRNSSLARVSFRARYEYLNRQGNYSVGDTTEYDDATDSYIITSSVDTGIRRYDVADQNQHKVALGTDLFITDKLGGGIELAWWDRDYGDTIYGMTGMAHYEAYVSANYGDPRQFLTTVYVGYELDESDLDTSRNWSQAERFDTISYGISLEVPAMDDRLKFNVAWNHSFVDGSADFSPASGNYVNLEDVDDYTLQTLEIKTDYRLTSAWSLNCGYTFEKFDLADGQYDGYTYLPSGATLSGAYQDQDYEAHVGWVGAKLRF